MNPPQEETREKFTDLLGWRYVYTQESNAELRDIENAESWDLDTLQALMSSDVVKNLEIVIVKP